MALGNTKPIEVHDGDRSISLNFVDAPIHEFVRAVFDDLLRETVLVDPDLKGRITLRTSAPITRAATIDLVRQALQINGASLIRTRGAYRVVARSDQRNSRRAGESIRIVPLRFVGADEARAALAPLTQTGVEIIPGPGGKYLSIAGPPAELDNLEQLLATLDVDQMRGMSFGLFPLKEAGAAALSSELTQMFGKGSDGDHRSFRALPITRMNAVLVISPQPALLNNARRWIARLDRADRDGRRIYVYPVQNRRAPEVAKVLSAIVSRARSTQTEAPDRPIAPQLIPIASHGQTSSTPISAALSPQTDDVLNNPASGADSKLTTARISADASTNSIAVVANPEEWRMIEAALRRLDVLAPQVLIEATIAEVHLNNSLRHGVRWYFETGHHGVVLTDSDTGSLSSVFPGFNYVFGTPKARFVLNALEQVTDVEIVSSPALTVLDNQTAKLQVGDQVPVATRSARSVVNPDAPIVNDIEFKDTGVILSVTPRINASGLVMLDIAQEVSEVVPTTTSEINSPTIRQRRVNSSVAIHSGTEIVLGGLIGLKRDRTKEGIPILMDIPLFGNAFRSRVTRGGERTELLVILRPTVIGNQMDVQNVTREIKARMQGSIGAIYR